MKERERFKRWCEILLLERLGDPENYPYETLAAYKEFEVESDTYYFTPGGFLYRKDPGAEGLLLRVPR